MIRKYIPSFFTFREILTKEILLEYGNDMKKMLYLWFFLFFWRFMFSGGIMPTRGYMFMVNFMRSGRFMFSGRFVPTVNFMVPWVPVNPE